MSENTNSATTEQTPVEPILHPYTPNVEKDNVCASNDKECMSRLVAAFSDCA